MSTNRPSPSGHRAVAWRKTPEERIGGGTLVPPSPRHFAQGLTPHNNRFIAIFGFPVWYNGELKKKQKQKQLKTFPLKWET